MRLIVIGCGSMGSHLALAMSRDAHQVSVVDSDSSAKVRLAADARIKFVHGVAIDLDVLKQAGIETADGLAAVTGDDDTNLAVALVARKHFRVPSVLARVFEPGKTQAYRAAGIHVVCPPAWGFRMIGDILTRPVREIVLTLGHGEVQVVAITVGAARKAVEIRHVTAPDIQAIALVRNGVASVPDSTTRLEPGDIVYFRVPEHRLAAFDRLVEELEG